MLPAQPGETAVKLVSVPPGSFWRAWEIHDQYLVSGLYIQEPLWTSHTQVLAGLSTTLHAPPPPRLLVAPHHQCLANALLGMFVPRAHLGPVTRGLDKGCRKAIELSQSLNLWLTVPHMVSKTPKHQDHQLTINVPIKLPQKNIRGRVSEQDNTWHHLRTHCWVPKSWLAQYFQCQVFP